MILLKKFSFWFTLFSLFVVLFNLLGYDDKNILLFLTSPPFWVTETHWFVVNFIHPSEIPLSFLYFISVLFWFLFGLSLDFLIKKLRKNK